MSADRRPAWMERPTKIGLGLKAVVLIVISLLVLYPFVSVVGTSLASEAEISQRGGLLLFPTHPTLDAYRAILSDGRVMRALFVSLGITVVGTLASLSVTIGLAYGLSRRGVVGGKFILAVVLFTMLFSPGIIANFLVVKQLGLINTFASLILPSLVSAFSLIILRSFFMNLPRELFEAARIDGAGDFRVLATIVLPLSKAVIAVVALFYGVGYWNSFFNAMLYINDLDKKPLSIILRQYVLMGQATAGTAGMGGEVSAPTQAIQMAVLVISVTPILIAYPFLQRYFTKGVLTGAIKG